MTPDRVSGLLRSAHDLTREHTYTALELFLFSAATWNPHRVHYDRDYNRGVSGEPELLVQGPLQAAHMVQLLRDGLADRVAIRGLEYRHRAVLVAGEPAQISGRLVSADRHGATIEMWVESTSSGERTTTGLARVEFAEAHPGAAGPATEARQEP